MAALSVTGSSTDEGHRLDERQTLQIEPATARDAERDKAAHRMPDEVKAFDLERL